MDRKIDSIDLQKKIEEFLKSNKIEDIVADMVNNLLNNMDKKPIVTMIKHLASYSTPEELKEHGIDIKDYPSNPKLAISYPQFNVFNNSLFKKILTQELFKQVKDIRTHKNINFRDLLHASLQNQDNSIGLFAIDQEVYTTFEPIFSPLLKEINLGYDLKSTFQRGKIENQSTTLKNGYKTFLFKLKIKAKRNFDEYNFNPMMTVNERDDLNKRIAVTLNRANLPIKAITSLTKMDSEVKHQLTQLNSNLLMIRSNENMRYKDWPLGRSIAVMEENDYCISINKEDHLELFLMKDRDINIDQEFLKVHDILEAINEIIRFNCHERLGYLCVNPKYTGIGLRIKLFLKIPIDKISNFRDNIGSLPLLNSFLQIEEIDPIKGLWLLKNHGCLGYTENELFKSITKTLNFILSGLLENDAKMQNFFEYMDSSRSEVYPFDESTLQTLIEKFEKNETEFNFPQIVSKAGTLPIIERGDFDILERSFIVARRNIMNIPYKKRMTKNDKTKVNKILESFAQTIYSEFAGDIYDKSTTNFEKILSTFLEDTNIKIDISNLNDINDLSLFRSKSQKLYILVNSTDHFIITYNYDDYIFENAQKKFSKILDHLEKKAIAFRFDDQIGYINNNPDHCGAGVELIFSILFYSNEPKDFKSEDFETIFVKKKSVFFHSMCTNSTKLNNGLDFINHALYKAKDEAFEGYHEDKIVQRYSPGIMEKLFSKAKSKHYLDYFNKEYRIKASSQEIYHELEECIEDYYIEALGDTYKKLNSQSYDQYDFEEVPYKEADLVLVKIEIARNFDSFPFPKLMTEEQKVELIDYVQNVFSLLEIKGNVFEYHEISHLSANLKSVFHDSIKVKEDEKVFLPVSRSFACWINLQDHIRLIGEISISDVASALKEIKRILEAFEEHGKKYLRSDKFGYLCERIDLCGIGMSLEIKIIASLKHQEKYLALFKGKDWRIKSTESTEDTTNILTFCSRGPYLIEDLFNDLKELMKIIEKLAKPRLNKQNSGLNNTTITEEN